MANTVSGVSVNKTKFVGVTDMKTLISSGVLRPSLIFRDVKNAGRDVVNNFRLREDMQRTFNKARSDNAKNYARYIRSIEINKTPGGCPPINLYCQSACKLENGVLEFPFRSGVMAIDGETQLEARFILLDEEAEGAESWLFPVVIWHNCGDDVARQYLVDTNLYANPINSVTALSMDRSGRLTQTVKKAILEAGFQDAQVNNGADLPGKRKAVSLRQATAAAVGYILNGHSSSKAYHSEIDELNNALPINERYEFDPETASRVVAEILQVANRCDVLHQAKPVIFQAAGIKARQGGNVQAFNFSKAIETLPAKGKGKLAENISSVKNAL